VSNHIIEAYIKSTSDTSPEWEDIRSGADMNEVGEIQKSAFLDKPKIMIQIRDQKLYKNRKFLYKNMR